LRQAQIVVSVFIPKIDSLPATPAFILHNLKIISTSKVRIKDEELQLASVAIEVNAQDCVS
jgi:hypothetical protein